MDMSEVVHLKEGLSSDFPVARNDFALFGDRAQCRTLKLRHFIGDFSDVVFECHCVRVLVDENPVVPNFTRD